MNALLILSVWPHPGCEIDTDLINSCIKTLLVFMYVLEMAVMNLCVQVSGTCIVYY